jgi:hypothetical protein
MGLTPVLPPESSVTQIIVVSTAFDSFLGWDLNVRQIAAHPISNWHNGRISFKVSSWFKSSKTRCVAFSLRVWRAQSVNLALSSSAVIGTSGPPFE